MKDYMDRIGATINCSVYGSVQDAGLVTLQLRERLKRLFHFSAPVTHVILTLGATWGLNMVIKCCLKPGDHCIVSSMEHNAVMRPLLQLEGVRYDRIPCNRDGFLHSGDIEAFIRPNTKLLTVNICRNTCPTDLNPEPQIYPAFTVGKRHCALWKR